ncbi:MAG TPA: SurA N-terminal domain-containing protein [Patescibacteria group bacterium]
MPRKNTTPKVKKTTNSPRAVRAPKKATAKKTSARVKKEVLQQTQSSNFQQESISKIKANTRNPRLWIGLAIVIVAILAFSFKGLFVAAVVNGQPISRLSVVEQLEKQNGKQQLDSMVTQTLITQEAQKRKVTVTQKDIDTDLTQIDEALKKQGQSLDTALAARGLSKQDLIDQIRLQKLVEKMVGSDVKVTDADVQKYIDDNKDNLPTDLSDDQLKSQVKQQLEQQQLQDKTQAFVANLQKNAKVSYFVSY